MNEKMKKIWDVVIEMNKNYIQTHKSFTPACFIIKKNYSLGIIMMVFSGSNAKEIMREKLKKMIVSQQLRGYILCMDTKMSFMNSNNEVEKVSDALIHSLFTPKETAVHTILYDPLTKEIIEERDKEGELISDWNVWNYSKRTPEQEKQEKDYFDFKQKNPDKFKGTF